MFIHVFYCSKTQKLCDEVVEKYSKRLKFICDYFRTQEMCEKVVKNLRLQ